jgi:hypothetical protein
MFNLFGTSGTTQFTGCTIFAITLASLVQVHALSSNTSIMGSARTEMAARVGVLGFYGKRVMIILWTFTGLIAVALFTGERALPYPDSAWGNLSRELLGPGLLGLMVVGVAAGVMSNLAAKAMAAASLFVQNFCRPFWPKLDEKTGVRIARWTIVAVFLLGVLCAMQMRGMEAVMRLVIIVNIPFGAVVFMMFFWRRLTATAVWVTLIGTVLVNLIVPMMASSFLVVRQHPALVVTVSERCDRVLPVYFDSVFHTRPDDVTSQLEGRGRFNLELFLLGQAGVDVRTLNFNQRLSAQYLWDAITPFIILILVSLVTRDRHEELAVAFFGKMKTPVGASPALDAEALEATRRDPRRFDHLKLFGRNSAWAFARWDRVDTLGFVICCALSGGFIGLFCLLLHWTAG